jgi:hypothetical protein
MNVTGFDREWVESIAGRAVTDEEILEFLRELTEYEESLNTPPELYREVDYWQ